MFVISRNEISKIAGELNFIRDTLEKALRLTKIIDYLNRNPLTKESTALKGGTAINLTIFSLPRLSVDIDLDLTRNLAIDEMNRIREKIRDDIQTYMRTQGYSPNPRSKTTHSLDSLLFSYANTGGARDNIKIEINYSLRAHIFIPELRTITISGFENSLRICTLAPVEIFAAKINALLSRAAPRDLYDVHNMIDFRFFDRSAFPLLRKSIIFYTSISQDEIPDNYNFDNIAAITQRKIKTELFPVIKKGEPFNLEEAKTRVIDFLNDLLTLEPNEREYLKEFKAKNYRPELLFADAEIIGRLKNHPMAIWKTK